MALPRIIAEFSDVTGRKTKKCYGSAAPDSLRRRELIILLTLVASVVSPEASGDPAGVWIPVKRDSAIERIHITGSPLDYIATVDYRCGAARCSTFQSLIGDAAHPPAYSVRLEGVGRTSMLALRWQKGPPCNRPGSDENPLAYWTADTARAPSGKTQMPAVGGLCLVHPPTPARQQR
jgi:hypothetical protein